MNDINKKLSYVDHLAIVVESIPQSVKYYYLHFNCKVRYKDSTWAMLEFENINLALVSKDEHPNHICLLYTSPSPRDGLLSRMPSSA